LFAYTFARVQLTNGTLLIQACALLGFVNIQVGNVVNQILPSTVETKAAFRHVLDRLGFAPTLYGDAIDPIVLVKLLCCSLCEQQYLFADAFADVQ
jgi:hypothetical protein